ncbi:MAG: hypothetical protein IT383_08075 [Deltaproteobacteria bacterium]|nr:hypothetical protein [Deltaproteobacteria bacterium]
MALASGQVRAQGTTGADLTRLERDLVVAAGELARNEDQYRSVPDLFTSNDRGERVTWGEIYYLTKEYQRASMLLFGAVEPRESDATPVEQRPDYADALYYLADSLYLLGNRAAAQGYFERLLSLRGHGHHEQAILRLMEMGDELKRSDEVDRYFQRYLEIAGDQVPGQVRYLRGKSLFLAGRDDAAIESLRLVPATDAWALRSRYLIGAAYLRLRRLPDALTMFDQVAFAKPIAKIDAQVKEMGHLARGRLLYEGDRLDESIDAYQNIDYDSPLLTTMLYEVTWTYVRRGQLAMRGSKGDNLTELMRRERAKVEYEKALEQLDDLRALDPDGARAAEIDILAGNLRLQRNEFTEAEQVFGDVLERHRAADEQLRALMADRSTRDRLLADILAMSSGGLTVDSRLPPIAARRASQNEDVAKALKVFKDIQASRDDIGATTRLLDELERQLSPDNPSRTELFKPLQGGVERSLSLHNTLLQLKSQALTVERGLARPSGEVAAQLQDLGVRRAELERRVAALPRTQDAIAARRQKLSDKLAVIDRAAHQVELEIQQRRAELAAVDFMVARDGAATELRAELRKNQVREVRAQVEALEGRARAIGEQIALVRKQIATAGGRGTSEDALRQAWSSSFDEERQALAQARDPAQASTYARLDQAVTRLDELVRRNTEFRARLDRIVDERLAGARALLAAEKEALATYAGALGDIDARATAVRDTATAIALDRVSYDLNRIVLRADVGVVDTSFARKQAETEKIGQLQRAKAADLTDLTQAFADLTRDEAP